MKAIDPAQGLEACLEELVGQMQRAIVRVMDLVAAVGFRQAALGAGLPLFKDLPAPLHLELVEATRYATGVAIHVYRPRSV